MENTGSYDFLDSPEYDPNVLRAKKIVEEYLENDPLTTFSLDRMYHSDPNLEWFWREYWDNPQIEQLLFEVYRKFHKIPGMTDLQLELSRFFTGRHEDRHGRLRNNDILSTPEEELHDYYIAQKLFRKRFQKLLDQYDLNMISTL